MALRNCPLPLKFSAEITMDTILGLVSELEEREAAVYVLLPWPAYTALPWHERAAAIAHYRTHILIEAHMHDASEREERKKEAMREQQGVRR